MKKPNAATDFDIPTKWVLITVAVLFVWAAVSTLCLQSKDRELRVARAQFAQREQNLTQICRDSERALATLREKYEALEKKAVGIIAFHEGKLDQVYPNLMRVSEGNNIVNRDYVVSYNYSGNSGSGANRRVSVVLRNDTNVQINPNVTFQFLTSEGFLTGRRQIGSWLFDSIKPGETRVEDDWITLSYGPAVYLALTIKK